MLEEEPLDPWAQVRAERAERAERSGSLTRRPPVAAAQPSRPAPAVNLVSALRKPSVPTTGVPPPQSSPVRTVRGEVALIGDDTDVLPLRSPPTPTGAKSSAWPVTESSATAMPAGSDVPRRGVLRRDDVVLAGDGSATTRRTSFDIADMTTAASSSDADAGSVLVHASPVRQGQPTAGDARLAALTQRTLSLDEADLASTAQRPPSPSEVAPPQAQETRTLYPETKDVYLVACPVAAWSQPLAGSRTDGLEGLEGGGGESHVWGTAHLLLLICERI